MTTVDIRSMALILLFVLVISGCYARRINEIELRLDAQQEALTAVEDSLVYVTRDVAYLDSMVGYKSGPVRTSTARTESRMDDLQTRIEILEALVKENRYKISRLSVTGRQWATTSDTTRARADSLVPEASVARHIFETAYVDFVKGDFESAISGFRDFLRRFAMTDFSDDAQFMIAQSFFVLEDYANAIVEFRKVLDNYPSGDRVPQAMYKLGLCYLKVEDTETAREYFKILVSRYPTAGETNRAEAMLDSLPPPPEDEGD